MVFYILNALFSMDYLNKCECGVVCNLNQVKKQESKFYGKWIYGCGAWSKENPGCKHFAIYPGTPSQETIEDYTVNKGRGGDGGNGGQQQPVTAGNFFQGPARGGKGSYNNGNRRAAPYNSSGRGRGNYNGNTPFTNRYTQATNDQSNNNFDPDPKGSMVQASQGFGATTGGNISNQSQANSPNSETATKWGQLLEEFERIKDYLNHFDEEIKDFINNQHVFHQEQLNWFEKIHSVIIPPTLPPRND